MRVISLCILAAMVAAASAASDFNFFPSNVVSEVSALGGPAKVACANGDCSFPSPWHLASQTAYPELGNAKAGGLLKIAVSDYFPKGPTLFFVPGAWCDTAGTGVNVKPDAGLLEYPTGLVPIGGAQAAAASTPKPAADKPTAAVPLPRRLMQADAAAPAASDAPVKAAAAPAAANAAPADEAAADPTEDPTAAAPDAEPEAGVAPDGANDVATPADAPAAEAPAAAAPAAADAPAGPAVEPSEKSTFTVNAGGTCKLAGDVKFKLGEEPAEAAEKVQLEGGATAYKIALPNNLANGQVCLTILATYNTAGVKTTPAYTEAFEPLGKTTVFSRKVCLYKLTKQANAQLDFDMCTNNKFMVNITDVSPLPVNVTVDDAPTAANLIRPLVKVWGGKVAELDGTPTEPRNYDEVASRTKFNWLARYFPVDSSYTGEPLSYTLSDTLQEGYYEVSTVVSVMTAYPLLTSLAGLTQITQDDASGEGVKGLWEAASRQVHTKVLVGVQKGSTPTTLSAISSSSHVPGQAVLAGQNVVLTWQFRGVGSATCTHDGQVVSNAEDGKCVSPLAIQARDVASTDTKHGVVVTFSDVCGGLKTAEFEYTQSGVRPLTATEIVNPDGTVQKIVDSSGGVGANGVGGVPGSIIGRDGSIIMPEAGEAKATNGTAATGAAGGRAAGATALAGAAALAAALLL